MDRLLGVIFGIMLSICSLQATTDTVTSNANSGAGSLRDALINANVGDTICFDPSIDGMIIDLSFALVVDTNVVILGNGADKTIIDGVAGDRIMTVDAGDTVSLFGLTLQNADLSMVSNSSGGAIENKGVLTCVNTIFRGNEVDNTGGAIRNQGTLTLINTVISGNRTVFLGGGVYNQNGVVTIRNSTISGNRSNQLSGGGLANGTGTMSMINTIVAKNISASGGPDISGTVTNLGNNLVGDNTSVETQFPSDGVFIGTGMNPVDPLFLMDVPAAPSSGGDLRLQCSSPAIDAGGSDTTGLSLGLVDLYGNPRVSGDSIDIGAYESGKPTVTSIANSGIGSLREAVAMACPGDTICFSPAISGDTIKLITEIVLDKNLAIVGIDTSQTIIDGDSITRIFLIASGMTVYLEGLTLQHGNGTGAQASGFGGAVFNTGTLALHQCKIICSSSSSSGGGIAHFGANLTISNSEVSRNSTSANGGGLYATSGAVELQTSKIKGNSASGNGGGICGESDQNKIINCEISGNQATIGGGLDIPNGIVDFINTVVTGNTAIAAGGFRVEVTSLSGTVASLTNTIVARNSASDFADIFKNLDTIYNNGGNLIGDNSTVSSEFPADGILIGTLASPVDPLFLMDVPPAPTTGGDLRLKCQSPAINAGKPDTTGLMIGPTDIAGLPRVLGDTIDIGPHEKVVDVFVDQVTLADNESEYKAINTLSSDATIDRDVTFKAGKSINLWPEFGVLLGQVFEALIEACSE